ncbi:MAG: hypothetical protein ACI959_000698 [Limisphaerales bacterium]|jgi:hypothetical protein
MSITSENRTQESVDYFKQRFLSRKTKYKRRAWMIRGFEIAFVGVGCYLILRNFNLF